jgi:hypothetical protein
VVNDVVYCTIQTIPSGVIASVPVQQANFDNNESGPQLTNLADAIEEVMSNPAVVAGVGSQTIEPSGLLADNVVFTVKYPAGDTSTDAITAEAVVPVGYLDFTDGAIGQASQGNVTAILNQVYDNLRHAYNG